MFRMPTKTRANPKKGARIRSKRRGANSSGGKLHDRSNVETGRSTLDKSPRKLEITVYLPTPSPNEWVWQSWYVYRDIKKDWLKRLHAASIRHCGRGLFGQPIENASLTIERRGIKELDEDNLKGGVKPVIDSLVQLGFLADDTPDVIQVMDVYQTHVGTYADQQTRITLIERE